MRRTPYPHARLRFEDFAEPLLALGSDYAQGLLDARTYNDEYAAILEAGGWTYEEYIAEVERQWDLSYTAAQNADA